MTPQTIIILALLFGFIAMTVFNIYLITTYVRNAKCGHSDPTWHILRDDKWYHIIVHADGYVIDGYVIDGQFKRN